MKRFDLKFAGNMSGAILDGRKKCTTRNTIHGYPGDVFSVMGIDFVVVSLWYWPLKQVRDLLYPLEGFKSPDEFEAFWQKHKYEFVEDQGRYVHLFDYASLEGFGYWPEPCDDIKEVDGND